MNFDTEVNVGHIATSASVLIAATALLSAASKDRLLRRREYADQIRAAAGQTAALLDRWRQVSLSLFDNVQPILTDIDALITKEQNITRARDELWRQLVLVRAKVLGRLIDEKLDTAYVGLFGYDPQVRELFIEVRMRLETVDNDCFLELLEKTQYDVLALEHAEKPYRSAQLGNALRSTVHESRVRLASDLEREIVPLRQRLVDLMESNDRALNEGKKI